MSIIFRPKQAIFVLESIIIRKIINFFRKQLYPDFVLLGGDNNSSNIGSDTNNQDKFMSYPGHIPHSNANPNYTIMYYTLYNMTGVSINDLLYSSTDIQCNIKYVVEEYDNDQNPLPFKTYYLIPSISFLNNQNQGGLFFSETENTEYKLTIKTTVDSTYSNNNQGRYNTQRINNNIITLGIYRNNRFYYAQINTNVYGNGLSLTTGNSTPFKLLLKSAVDQYKFLYQYHMYILNQIIIIIIYIYNVFWKYINIIINNIIYLS